ncbi:MAG: tRNA pseudouridine(55) synthase TruB [Blastocatellia bacterium]
MMDGILIVDKPDGMTSHDVVAKVRRLFRTRRAGHAGTLDPFATGVLVVCLNQATRLAGFLTGEEKEYVATMRLGFATDTGDLTGAPLGPIEDARAITADQAAAALAHFRGRIEQIPPMYSAKKVGGVKLYEMARRGETIERAPIEIEIRELELCEPIESAIPGDPITRDLSFRVVCSSGTYVRTLAEEIGRSLGIGAHLVRLRRTRAGRCEIHRAFGLEQLASLAEAERLGETLIPMAEAVSLPAIPLTPAECKDVSHGRSIPRNGGWRHGEQAKLCDAHQRLIAIAVFDAEKLLWQPKVVFAAAAAAH